MNAAARSGCGIVCVLGLVLAARGDGPISFGPGGSSPPVAVDPNGLPLQTTVVIGTGHYMRGMGTQDMMTLAEGGAAGSAALMWQVASQRVTQWFFIEGDGLYVRRIGDPNWGAPVTTTPGEFVTSQAGGQTNRAPLKNGRRLTGALVMFYRHTVDTQLPIRHTPFLAGTGWDVTSDPNCGANYIEARQVLRALDLNLAPYVPTDTDPNCMCVCSQTPAAGTPIDFGATVTVTWGPCPHDPNEADGTWMRPIDIPATGSGLTFTGTIVRRHLAALHTTDCALPGREFCFRLPAEVSNKRVTLTGALEMPDQSINVYVARAPFTDLPERLMDANGNHICARGLQPSITFSPGTMDPNETRLLVAVQRENAPDTGDVALIARWEALPTAQTAAAAPRKD